MEVRRSRVWREFVMAQSPGAVGVKAGDCFNIIGADGAVIGSGRSPMGAWHDAFNRIGGTEETVRGFRVPEATTPAEEIVERTPAAPVTAALASTVSAAYTPVQDPTFYIDPKLEGLFGHIQASAPEPQNIMLIGPHGCGKTETALQYAARTGKPLLVMDCAHTREGYLWWGRMHVNNGTTYFKPSDFFKAVEAGNHVILLDELNRVDSSILSPLMPLLDGRRATHVPDTDHILKVGPGTVFFATMNEGSQYTGTSALDAAIQDRFSYRVEVDYLDKDQEVKVVASRTGVTKADATKLVALANAVRKKAVGYGATLSTTISTRQLIATAKLFKTMGVNALDYSIASHFSADGGADSERRQVLTMIQGKFGAEAVAEA
jgi:nitric oxide reductase NorQ protein